MTADVFLTNGNNYIVENLECIAISGTPIEKITEFSNFFIIKNRKYSFQGSSSILVVNAEEIHNVVFSK